MIEHKNTVYNRSTPLRNITLILYGSKLYHLSINALFFKLTSIVFPMNNQKQNQKDYDENTGLKVSIARYIKIYQNTSWQDDSRSPGLNPTDRLWGILCLTFHLKLILFYFIVYSLNTPSHLHSVCKGIQFLRIIDIFPRTICEFS